MSPRLHLRYLPTLDSKPYLTATLPHRRHLTCSLDTAIGLQLQALDLHRATAKLGYIVTALFAGLLEQGFCVPDATREGVHSVLTVTTMNRYITSGYVIAGSLESDQQDLCTCVVGQTDSLPCMFYCWTCLTVTWGASGNRVKATRPISYGLDKCAGHCICWTMLRVSDRRGRWGGGGPVPGGRRHGTGRGGHDGRQGHIGPDRGPGPAAGGAAEGRAARGAPAAAGTAGWQPRAPRLHPR